MNTDQHAAVAELRRSFLLRTFAAAGGFAATFVLSAIALRTMSNRDAAVFLAMLAALPIGSLIGRLGLGMNLVRLLPAAKDPHMQRVIMGTHLRATFYLCIVSAPVVSAVAALGIRENLTQYILVVVLTTTLITVESVRLTFGDLFAIQGRVMAAVAASHYFRTMTSLPIVAILVFVLHLPGLVPVLATYTAAATMQMLVAGFRARHYYTLRGHIRGSLIPVVRSGFGLAVPMITSFLFFSGTIWLAAGLFAPRDAAQYAAAAALATQAAVLESLAVTAATPVSSRLWHHGRRHFAVEILSSIAVLSAVVTFVVFVGTVVLGKWILGFAYGADMVGAYAVLVILTAAAVVRASFGVNITLLHIAGKTRESARTAFVMTIVFMPVVFLIAWFGGPISLAIASSVASIAIVAVQWLTAAKSVGPELNGGHATLREGMLLTPHPHVDVVSAWKTLRSARGGPVEVST
ncbi:MAG: teichoic acid transporter [Nocardiaceae bacterium]|nr:teichoic acid transporter [Nocardiaceae bacterium]